MSGSSHSREFTPRHHPRLLVIRILCVCFLALIPIYAIPADKTSDFDNELNRGSLLIRAGEIRKAATLFDELLQSALKIQDEYAAARARIGIAACALITHDYKKAVENGELALRYGVSTKNADLAVRAALNVSGVYRRNGDYAAASQTLRELNPILPQITDPGVKAPLYLHAGMNALRQGDYSRAETLFFAGVDSALAKGDLQMAATGWNQIGFARLRENHLQAADEALTEAFRLRHASGKKNLGASYVYLGMLRLAQQDPKSALNLFDRAVDLSSRVDVSIPLSVVYYRRATAKIQLADVPGALADFDRAIQWAGQWRQEVLPADGFRISAEVALDSVFREYVQVGMAHSFATNDKALARRMFEVSEQHRSASFRERLLSQKQPPAEYWEALASYRSALVAALGSDKTEAVESARLKLARLESGLGLDSSSDVTARVLEIQQRLSPDEALLSFHTAKDKSYVWAITRNTFESHLLAGLDASASVARQYREGVEKNALADDSNSRLYQLLFGSLTSSIQSRKDWLLSLDEGLYDIPFAALGSVTKPLIFSHSLRTIPGAALLNRPGESVVSEHFVGAGDAIYNPADARWRGPRPSQTSPFARLVNTKREILTVSQAWTADNKPTLLFGESFNRSALENAFQTEPAIIHIAAHVVRGRTDASNVMIGIGLKSDGHPDFLTPADIASRPARLGLVSVNGCASGAGAALPGAGLIGLTRAWLLAGASAVAATYWPVNDDRGALFAKMYSEMAQSPGHSMTAASAARALQSAQIESLRSGTTRARPSYWAAVFIAGKR